MSRRISLSNNKITFFDSNGTNKILLQCPPTLTSDYSITLPLTQGGSNQVLQNDGSGNLTWADISEEGQLINYNYKDVTTSTYSILPSDFIIGVNTTGNCTLTLPMISSVGKISYKIIDTGGNASINNIHIVPSGSDTLFDDNRIILSEDYNSVTLLNDSTSKWFVV